MDKAGEEQGEMVLTALVKAGRLVVGQRGVSAWRTLVTSPPSRRCDAEMFAFNLYMDSKIYISKTDIQKPSRFGWKKAFLTYVLLYNSLILLILYEMFFLFRGFAPEVLKCG